MGLRLYEEKCKKCGCEMISTQYVPLEDKLKKACRRCGYEWYEQCEDAKEK